MCFDKHKVLLVFVNYQHLIFDYIANYNYISGVWTLQKKQLTNKFDFLLCSHGITLNYGQENFQNLETNLLKDP